MSDIIYTYKKGIYFNLTNQCPCNCTFCIRSMGEGLGSANSLWLEHDPSFTEIAALIDAFDFTGYEEVIFCGYGEPLCAFDNLIATSKYIRRKHPDIKIRVNTNGLGDLINGKPTAKLLCENVDAVSISLNAPSAEKYLSITQPSFGLPAFESMLQYAKECKENSAEVILSVVDTLPAEDISQCMQLAQSLNIPLRVRTYGE